MVAQSNTTPESPVHGLLYDTSKELYMADKTNPRRLSVNEVFAQLEVFRDFCSYYGYRYDPADCWNIRSFQWQQYQKLDRGKDPTNNWLDQLARLNGRRSYN